METGSQLVSCPRIEKKTLSFFLSCCSEMTEARNALEGLEGHMEAVVTGKNEANTQEEEMSGRCSVLITPLESLHPHS